MGRHGSLFSLREVHDKRVDAKHKKGQLLWAAMVFYSHLGRYLIRVWMPKVNKGSLCGLPWFSIVVEGGI